MSIFRRLYFLLVGRWILALRHRGFRADWLTFVDSRSRVSTFSRIYGKSLVANSNIGAYTYATRARICNTTMGRFCSIGPDSLIGGLGRHPTNWLSSHPAFYSLGGQCGINFGGDVGFSESLPVEVGNDVWIGARVIVLDGVRIGDGAIIAAGAVVVEDVNPYMIVGGVPAKVIRRRYPNVDTDTVRNLRWWDWPENVLKENAELFTSELGVETLARLVAKASVIQNRTSE